MMRAIALCTLLTGCNALRILPSKQETLDLHIDPMCYAPCTENGTAVTTDPDSAVVAAIVEYKLRQQCELRRKACSEAIKRGQDAKVIQ